MKVFVDVNKTISSKFLINIYPVIILLSVLTHDSPVTWAWRCQRMWYFITYPGSIKYRQLIRLQHNSIFKSICAVIFCSLLLNTLVIQYKWKQKQIQWKQVKNDTLRQHQKMSFDLNITLPKDIYIEILSVHHQHMIQICFINPGMWWKGS